MEQDYKQEDLPGGNSTLPKKSSKHTFLKGVLAGAGGMLALVLVVAMVTGGILLRLGINPLEKNSASQRQDTQENEIDIDSEASLGTGDTGSLSSLMSREFLEEVSTIYSHVQQNFLYEVNEKALQEGMLKGLVEGLEDPYSNYFTELELTSFMDSSEGEYYGIGATLSQDIKTGIVRILYPYPGTPSAEAGLMTGDIVISVNDTEVTDMDLNQVVTLIKGEEGTTVKLHIYRESDEKYTDINIERKKIEVPTVTAEMLDNQIGYIILSSFDRVTAKQFINAYQDLQAQGMKGVIVDLRNNGGGFVDSVEEILDYLLPEGVIFYAKDKSGTRQQEYSSDANAALDIPMVMLVNENTASAAEIFCGNVRAFNAGKLVGVTTYGKGVMQKMYFLNENTDATAVKLTIADYYIHGDKNINGVGFVPDVEVALSEEAKKQLVITKEQDNQLQEAISVLSKEMQ